MYILGKFKFSGVNYPLVLSDFNDNWDRSPNYKLFTCPTQNLRVQHKIVYTSVSPYSSCFHAYRRTDSYLNSLYWRKWRHQTRHSSVIRTYQSGSEPGINCSKCYSDINLVVVTRHSGGVHCSLMCCMTPGGPCDLQPHVEGGPVSHTTGDVTWRSSAPWRIRQWGKTARRSCKPYVLSLPRQVWLLGYHCAHHENNLFCRNKWSLGRFVSFIRQYTNDCFLTLCSPVVTIGTTSVTFNNSTFWPHTVFMCFMWIWEQTAIIFLCSINWLVFMTQTECLLRGTECIFIYNSAFCPRSLFMCFVWIWEQRANIFLYGINWLVFIIQTECVSCAVGTGSLYIILRSAHTVYLCVLCGSENKQRLFPYTTLTDWFL